MKKSVIPDSIPETKPLRPAIHEEAREKQCIALAMDLAEEQLRNGTASSQVISHFLKLGSTTAVYEKEILKSQKQNLDAKTAMMQSMQKNEELFKNALTAVKLYSGKTDEEYAEKF